MKRIAGAIKIWTKERQENLRRNWFSMFLAVLITVGVLIEVAYLKAHL